MKEEHKKHQEANDWVTCKCGKVFKKSRFKEHLISIQTKEDK